jgi:hypothetical protein
MSAETQQAQMSVPDDCFVMIRLPVSVTAFAEFAKASEKIAPGCVTRQEGQFLLILHTKKKEGE